MDRRGFFKSLALMAGAVSVSPTIFIPKFEPVKWKRPFLPIIFKRNPEWEIAQYEIRFIDLPPVWLSALPEPPDWIEFKKRWAKIQKRYEVGLDGYFHEVPPFIES